MSEESAHSSTQKGASPTEENPDTAVAETHQPLTSQALHLFINVTEPSQANKKQTKRAVRSHAARISSPQNSATPTSQDSTTAARKRRNQTFLLQIHDPTADIALVLESNSQSPSTEGSPARSSTSGLLTPLSGYNGSIPASRSPLYNRPYIPAILDNYLENLAVPIPEIDDAGPVALLRSLWFPVILHNPTIFHVIVLFSASHYVAQSPDSSAIHLPTILFLKQCALQSLASLAASSLTIPSDELIAAAAKMASYEAIFGDKDAFNIHMQSVRRMVLQRGGLSRLGLSGFLARLLLFIDTNSAHLLGTHLYLDESSLPRQVPFQPNPDRFIGAPIRRLITDTPETQAQTPDS